MQPTVRANGVSTNQPQWHVRNNIASNKVARNKVARNNVASNNERRVGVPLTLSE